MTIQQLINEEIYHERLKTLELVEEIIADVKNGQNPMEAMATLLTIVKDDMVTAGERAGKVTAVRLITKDGVFELTD